MNIIAPGEGVKKLMPNAQFVVDASQVQALAERVVGSGLGASFLRKGDLVIAVKGLTKVISPRPGQQDPIEYLAVVFDVQEPDGAIKEKIAAFSTLLRRKPGANTYHGIFAEPQFEKVENYVQAFDTLAMNPRFRVADVVRNVEFPTFKATVLETVRG